MTAESQVTYYPIWSAICDIHDQRMRMAMALLDLNSDEGKHIAASLLQYFTTDKPDDLGPVLLSVLQQTAYEEDGEHNCLVTDRACDRFSIPYDLFNLEDFNDGGPLLPDDLKYLEDSKFGDRFTWQGTEWMIVEKHDDQLWFVPAERILDDRTK